MRVFLPEFFFAWTLSCTSACFRACLRVFVRVFFLACFLFFFYKFPAQDVRQILSDSKVKKISEGWYLKLMINENQLGFTVYELKCTIKPLEQFLQRTQILSFLLETTEKANYKNLCNKFIGKYFLNTLQRIVWFIKNSAQYDSVKYSDLKNWSLMLKGRFKNELFKYNSYIWKIYIEIHNYLTSISVG